VLGRGEAAGSQIFTRIGRAVVGMVRVGMVTVGMAPVGMVTVGMVPVGMVHIGMETASQRADVYDQKKQAI